MADEKLAFRLADILIRLNRGERLNAKKLAEQYSISERTIRRDLTERFAFLNWNEDKHPYYQLDRKKLGHLTPDDIQRFAKFASISQLFPKIDRTFYEEKLLQSVQVKGLQYEDISHYGREFDMVKSAVENHRVLIFKYSKNNGEIKHYQIAPYSLLNKNGVWYVIGTDQGKQKTFCFTQMSLLRELPETFTPDENLVRSIKENDSLSHGNQLAEVIIQVSKFAAPYFLRRNLLPNQELVRKLDYGGLILACPNVNEMDVIPLVQYWIPHLVIISPQELQQQIEQKLRNYLTIGRIFRK
ncbi:WYL domain-containing transcriptional regulator [Bisgaard Taxon 10/6]|uniref:WYL domain-containing transcriptional regulator n=1 Tax=Exercitatus varius TaxID=67857 RepID=A0ABT6ERT5_9PAST|nr:WYL domain-containing transcriptional regulator [Exercitatus varius]MDG2938713.1 WYL domain-containing transcriptional regulator [Exercitatus varius]MDG2946085.1 WYL domain-containing transcriptional regulator [Exercitatus varius]MDG2955392.1 WYL domain-containing transcriptional regulator [Exercitatus varius]MDG2962786.1 WYL domain-containing transcriptional regulator [Exercitatus varius]MDG2963674.1 WYL domain-containing transcriptional regulator [Exercitatus varius]